MNQGRQPSRAIWLARRLAAMPPPEIGLRVWRVVRDRAWMRAHRWPIRLVPAGEQATPARESASSSDPDDLTDAGHLAQFAFKLAHGEEPMMGWGWCVVGTPPNWRTDPVTGQVAPGGFGPSLNHRDPRRFGEVRRIWELSRHHRWVVFAWAFRDTGRETFRDTLANEILDWCSENPFPEGPHWSSALEVAVRLASWSRVHEVCAHELPAHAQAALANGAHRSLEFILAHRSVGTSANNHALGESVGLIVGADAWPNTPIAARARDTGWRVLARSVSTLIDDDGWFAEQSVGYAVFVLDLLMEALRAPSAANRPEAAIVLRRAQALTSCLMYLEALGDPPAIGDDDEGKCLPAPDPESRWDAVLSTAAPALLGVTRAPRTPWGAVALAHRGMPSLTDAPIEIPPLASRAFASGGVVTLVRGPAAAMVDVGPLGFGAIAAHGHADCLQVLLWHGRRPILIDPGMPTYYEQPTLRDQFRGTGAHNTVTVMSVDQSEILGTFLWGKRARVIERSWNLHDPIHTVEATHDGYRRLPSCALHTRRVSLSNTQLSVVDEIEAPEPVDWCVSWQFHPECRLEGRDSHWTITWPEGRMSMSIAGADIEVSETESEVARRFGARIVAPRLVVRTNAPTLTTTFTW